jgi:TPR repeat protein
VSPELVPGIDAEKILWLEWWIVMNNLAQTRQYNASINYNKGYDRQEKGDIHGAIAAYEAAANFGATDAMSRLGTIYGDMKVPSDQKLAIYWYKRGVRLGDAGCAWNLAMHYAGTGNKRWYVYWLKIAGRMGYPDSENEIRNRNWWNKRRNSGDIA